MTLHKTVVLIQKTAKIVLIGGGSILSLIILFRIGVLMKDILFPKPPELPNARFGKLPAIPFGEPALTDKFTYAVETITGSLPTLTDRVNVYKIIHNDTTLLNAKEADRKAAAIDFIDSQGNYIPHKALTPTDYEWTDSSDLLPRTLTMDINTYNFVLDSDFLSYPPITQSTYIANQDGGKGLVSRMLNSMNLLSDDIDQKKTTAEILTVKNGTLIPAVSLSTAQIMRINFFQKDIDELPIFYPRYPYSTMDFYVTSRALDITDVVEGHFSHQQVKLPDPKLPDPADSASYPIKTADEAFKELQAGKGFIANYSGSSKNINITDVSLGYFLGDKKMDYIMPVIVFHGEEGQFYGFVSAIQDSWIAP